MIKMTAKEKQNKVTREALNRNQRNWIAKGDNREKQNKLVLEWKTKHSEQLKKWQIDYYIKNKQRIRSKQRFRRRKLKVEKLLTPILQRVINTI